VRAAGRGVYAKALGHTLGQGGRHTSFGVSGDRMNWNGGVPNDSRGKSRPKEITIGKGQLGGSDVLEER